MCVLQGVNLGPKGQLTLVQVSTVAGQVIIFDVQTTPALLTQGGLQRLLESEQVIKVSYIFLLSRRSKIQSGPNGGVPRVEKNMAGQSNTVP